jgi:outer membrane receptor protein involved in Fe transport
MNIKNYLILLFISCSLLFAGETGRIVGRVIDAQTQEPLSGVNVIVEATELGAATGDDGRYLITNVQSRRYNVTASYIGFEPMTIKDVLVILDQAVTVDFKLRPTTIMIDKPVIVQAEREMVIRTAVATTRTASSEEFNRLPVNALTQLIGLQAGVRQDDTRGWTHIRGGRYDDVSYLIDGVAARDAVYGVLWSSPKPTTEAIQEVIVITGSFDPEYGEAMSGIVQAITKEGGTKTSTRIKYTTDEMFPNPNLNFGYNEIQWTIGGPIPFYNRLRYFISSQYLKTDDASDARYKVQSPRGEMAAEGKLTYQLPKSFPLTLEGLKLTVDGHLSEYQWQGYSHSRRYLPQAVFANRVRSHKANLHLNQMLTQNIVWTLKTGLFNTALMRAPRDLSLESADTTGFWDFMRSSGIWDRYQFMGEDWVFDNPQNLSIKDALLNMYIAKDDTVNYRTTIDGRDTTVMIIGTGIGYKAEDLTMNNPYGVYGLFVGEGNMYFHYRTTATKYVKGDISWTPNKVHELKTGFDLTQYTIAEYTNQSPYDPNPFWEYYQAKPLTFATFIQDRADFEDLVVRGGLRFDYLDAKATRRLFPDSVGGTVTMRDSMVPVDVKLRLSPRLGLSFPLSERVKFRFSYGHFFKNPTFGDLFSSSEFSALDIQRRPNLIAGNPDLAAEKTIAYEMGFDSQLSDVFAFDLTTYYKDVYDLSGTRVIQSIPSYTMYYNVEYARIMGAEATFTKQLSNYWRASASYTYQIAKGTASTASAAYTRGYVVQIDYPLDHDVRHQASLDFSLSFPPDFVFIPLRDFEGSLLNRFNTGLPYTPEDIRGTQIADENSARMPGSFSIDSRLHKTIRIKNMNISVFCDIFNLLNADLVTTVFTTTGSASDRGRRFSVGEFSQGYVVGDYYYHPARDFDHDGYITRYEMYKSYMDAYNDRYNLPTYYGPPRKIRFGLSFGI